MKTYTTRYSNYKDLKEFVSINNIASSNSKSILVQVFTAINDEFFIKELVQYINTLVPTAKIIGTTSCGEIDNDGAVQDSTIISFSLFNETTIETSLQVLTTTSYELGRDIAHSFEHNDDLKIIITFTDGLVTNGEEYLNGISSVDERLVISGGMAGDNGTFTKTYVFDNMGILSSGAVAVALYNKDLQIYTDYSFNWESVGKKHIVTKSDKNRVYKIDDKTAVDFYKYYLGEDIAKFLPAIGIEFPLVIKREGVTVARAIISKYDDGSLGFAGNIDEGTLVQFGHGDVQMIIDKGVDSIKNILDYPVESIFIYSCMARRALLKDDINLELLPLREIAPISGFFTYGEFYHNCKDDYCKSQLLNQTMTLVGISEKTKKIEKVSANIFSANPPSVDNIALHRTQALSNLIERTTSELEELNNELEQRVKEEVQKNSQKDAMLHMMQSQASLGEMIEMIIHQWRQPLSAITSTVSSTQVYKTSGILTDDMLDEALEKVLSYVEHLNSTIGDFRELFRTELRKEPIKVTKLMDKSNTIVAPILRKHNIKLVQEFDCYSDVNVSIGLMMQVILNIIKNAVDILIEKDIDTPTINISISKNGDMCDIKIADNGGGIPEDILDRIFEKRFTTKGKNGTGIGLDMSKMIIETKLDGRLTAHNEDGWAVFTISLPVLKK